MPAHQFDLAPQSSRELEQPESYFRSKQKVCLHIDLRFLRPSIVALMAFHFKTAHFRGVRQRILAFLSGDGYKAGTWTTKDGTLTSRMMHPCSLLISIASRRPND